MRSSASPHRSTIPSPAATCASRAASAGATSRIAVTDRMPPALSPEHPLFGLGYAEPVREREFTRLEGGQQEDRASVAEEVPVAFIYNGRPHVVMMATPADLEDFAAGFSLTEEIVGSVSEISRLEVVRHAQGIELQLAIPEAAANRLEARGRQLVGQTGCGLCGVETVAEALRPPRRLPDGRPPVPRSEERRVGKEGRWTGDWSSDVCSSDLYRKSPGSRSCATRRASSCSSPFRRLPPTGWRPAAGSWWARRGAVSAASRRWRRRSALPGAFQMAARPSRDRKSVV